MIIYLTRSQKKQFHKYEFLSPQITSLIFQSCLITLVLLLVKVIKEPDGDDADDAAERRRKCTGGATPTWNGHDEHMLQRPAVAEYIST